MKTYLQLNTSLHGAASQSSRLGRQFIETMVRADRGAGAADLEFVYAEGLAMGEESRSAALVEAGKRIEQLAA